MKVASFVQIEEGRGLVLARQAQELHGETIDIHETLIPTNAGRL